MYINRHNCVQHFIFVFSVTFKVKIKITFYGSELFSFKTMFLNGDQLWVIHWKGLYVWKDVSLKGIRINILQQISLLPLLLCAKCIIDFLNRSGVISCFLNKHTNVRKIKYFVTYYIYKFLFLFCVQNLFP